MKLAYAAVTAAILGSSASALANPVELGAGVGLTQASSDAQSGDSSRQTDTLFGRIGLLGPISIQGELGRIDVPDSYAVRSLTAAAVLELGHRSVVPFILAGGGVDQISTSGSTSTTTYERYEIGAGIEYRMHGGLSIGLDLREGTRSGPPVYYAAPGGLTDGGGVARFVPAYSDGTLTTGEYRTARLTVGVTF